ncbi:MAG: hypothetical protein ABIR83_09190 [Nakamurella sp.]
MVRGVIWPFFLAEFEFAGFEFTHVTVGVGEELTLLMRADHHESMTSERELMAVDLVIDRLALRFEALERSDVEAVVANVYRSFDDCLMRSFVPLLVEHAGRDRLLRMMSSVVVAPRPDTDVPPVELHGWFRVALTTGPPWAVL